MSTTFLKILTGPRQGLNVPLSGSSILLIGRKKGELILNDPLVSSSHAKIFPTQDGWFIEDLGSTNGTTVDGQLIRNSQIRPGAEITIGNSRMILFVGLAGQRDEQEPPPNAQQQLDIAWLLPEEQVELDARPDRTRDGSDIIDLDLRLPPSMRAELEVVAGQDLGNIYKFENGNMIIGRRTGAVPLSDGEVSKYHAVIEIFGRNMIFLRDRESTNGTFHNGRRILSAKLQNGDTIGLGRSVLRLRVR